MVDDDVWSRVMKDCLHMSLVFLENDIPLALRHLMLGCSFSLQVRFGAAWKKNSSRPCTLLLDVIRPCVQSGTLFRLAGSKINSRMRAPTYLRYRSVRFFQTHLSRDSQPFPNFPETFRDAAPARHISTHPLRPVA